MVSDAWMTRKQVASHWGISVTTVDRMILRGELKAVRFGKTVRIPAAAVAEYERGRGAVFDAV